jgi:2-(1,2-epoxy-1,2-dihydrophenyl)acetyl-CoA isomerase
MTSTDATLTLEGPVGVITLNRPARYNAIDLGLLAALQHALTQAEAHPSVRALVLCGAGRSFCSGGDIAAMQQHAADLPGFIGRVIDGFHEVIVQLAQLRMPVIAAVHGAAAGGGFSLALAADLTLAARSARFVVAYPQLGTSTDGGLSFRLQQRLGASRALALLTQPGPVSAEAAAALQLVHTVTDDDSLMPLALQQAQQLAALPEQAVRELKALVQAPQLPALQAHLAREREAFLRCAHTADFAARVAAFANRSPSGTSRA